MRSSSLPGARSPRRNGSGHSRHRLPPGRLRTGSRAPTAEARPHVARSPPTPGTGARGGGRRGWGGSRAAPQRGSCASANAQKQLRQTAATYMLTARGGSRSAERKGDLQKTFRQRVTLAFPVLEETVVIIITYLECRHDGWSCSGHLATMRQTLEWKMCAKKDKAER
ncbi:putative uncharacterized protein MED14OS isoform X1 [Rhinopithecus roxellana]|uniref:putative uncharacterized protein MED14OS isoform X1 n=1 Tax=Rhinopithecus roxellana TaxID=61622 RepID=UPI0012371888|nr:putative uncharacterized protein MED14OS isoform X1 [Rhinopithecus roxellana]